MADYVALPDTCFAWQKVNTENMDGLEVTTIKFISQQWREGQWRHTLYIARPQNLSCPDTVWLEVTYSANTSILPAVKKLAEASGAWVAVLSDIPNQPLYGGKYEDALIAHTFDQYLKSDDPTWPLLLPMTKSATRAMDVVQAWSRETQPQPIERFVLSGASKRGWTSWLAGAVDKRVCAIVPVVIDMLNLEKQTAWSQRVYGAQSEKIHDYTDIGLMEKMGQPATQRLMEIVDPYSYRALYTMPKLLLLGTNDPYWTVDSLRHYWDDLPAAKALYQAPNAGHNAGSSFGALQTRTAFLRAIATKHSFPQLTWQRQPGTPESLHVTSDQRAKSARLWLASSPTRDFRKTIWRSQPLELSDNGLTATAPLTKPDKGYNVFMVELSFEKSGLNFALSTQACVTPD